MVFRPMTAMAAVAFSSMAGVAAPAGAESLSPPENVKIEVKSLRGNGCNRGTADVVMNEFNTAFTVKYREFMAEVGPYTEMAKSRKTCQFIIEAHAPEGYGFAIKSSNFRGYARLAEGVTGKFISTYYTSAGNDELVVQKNFFGPMSDLWQVHRDGDTGLSKHLCDKDKHINVKQVLDVVTRDKPTGSSFMTIDGSDHSSESVFELDWKRC